MTVKSVLVVEDEFLVALDMETILVDAGFEVLGPVGSVAEALRLIGDQKPDAALLDNNLNGQSVGPVAAALGDSACRSRSLRETTWTACRLPSRARPWCASRSTPAA